MTKKVLIIDGQGGRIGKLLVEGLKAALPELHITAIGSNSIATAAMMRAGADQGATGENPVVVNARDADIIAGPVGIVMADSLLGEITPKMACAVAQSRAQKVLIPINKCSHTIIGIGEMPLSEYIKLAVSAIASSINK